MNRLLVLASLLFTTLFSGGLRAAPSTPAAPGSAAKSPAVVALTQRLEALATSPKLDGASVGMIIMRMRDGRVLFAREADKLVAVASNTKLVTCMTALKVLGPTYRFRTAFYGKLRAGIVDGDLTIKGYGDPTMGTRDLWLIAQRLRQRGVRRITGGIVIDERYFDKRRLAPLYASRPKSDWYYRPAVGALSIEENAIGVRVVGAETAGEPARVVLRPRSSYLRVKNEVITVAPGRRSWIKLRTKRKGRRTLVEVRGRVRVGFRSRLWRKRIVHPGYLFAHSLIDQLRRARILVGRRRVKRGRAPTRRERPLYTYRSQPLGTFLRYAMKVSSNFTFEQLVKIIGAEKRREPGTWRKGLAVIAASMQKLGIARSAYSMKNGSGLYDGNRFTPRQLATVLRASVRDVRIGPDYLASLPIAGYDGTLSLRFKRMAGRGLVRAKTGTLAQVVSLSGVAASPKRPNERLVFSLLITGFPRKPGRIRRARKIADTMASELVGYLGR